jgi:hypothetical protein
MRERLPTIERAFPEGVILQMSQERSILADRANRYRQVAIIIRAQIPVVPSAEARDQLFALAADYERLARRAHEPKSD